MDKNVLLIYNRHEFRAWLEDYSRTEPECWLLVKRGKPVDEEHFWYIDAVEEAICFGWIDSTQKIIAGERRQRFSPRRKNSPWTELNKERARRLERLGLMTDQGRAVLPDMSPKSFVIDKDIEAALREAGVWTKFKSFPALYRKVRAYNVAFYKKRSPQMYESSLAHLIAETKSGRMYGEWDDFGRLTEK